MTLDARDFKMTGQWAKDADIDIPPIPLTGRTYRKPGLTQKDFERGQPFDEEWESARNNQKDFEVSGIALQASKLGITVWSPLEDYVQGSIQLGTDGVPYRCMIAHGPNTIDPANIGATIGPKDPSTAENVGDESYWLTLARYLVLNGMGEMPGMSYTPEPKTGALRNEIGCTQVNDPVLDLDAANKRWVQNEISRGSSNIVQPVITAPADNYIFQTLGVSVTVSQLELKGGGLPMPTSTQIRVLGSNEADIVANAVLPYTTEPSVTVPEIVLGDTLYVMVRHRDEAEGWSTWSEKKPLKMAAVIQQAAIMITPGRYAQNIPFHNLSLSFSGGRWSDGSTYSGSQTSLLIYNVATGAITYNSGWLSYRTSLTLPNGTLAPGTTYWAAAQHKAASAPAKNPNAILEGPKITDANNTNATVFTTMPAKAPDISALRHSFPGGMIGGRQKSVKIWGATSTDGTEVTYRIQNVSSGLSFSKTTGITANEVITVGAATSTGQYGASFQIVAVSASGSSAQPVTVTMTIIVQTVYFYQHPDGASYTFTAPVRMAVKIEVGGPGGGGIPLVRAGGGGGAAIINSRVLEIGNYSVIVGRTGLPRPSYDGYQDATPSSFGGFVYATGGIVPPSNISSINEIQTGGVGVGGEINTYGGQAGTQSANGVKFSSTVSGAGGAGYSNGTNGSSVPNWRTPGGGGTGGGNGEDIPWGSQYFYGGQGGIGGGGSGVASTAGRGGAGCVRVTILDTY